MNRTQKFAYGISFALILLLYWWTAPPSVTWEHGGIDGAELAFASYTGGVAHPPGYGLYTLLGWLATHIVAFVPPIQVMHFLSHLYALIALGAAAYSASLLAKRQGYSPFIAGLSTVWMLGLSASFWQQAIITEVYAFLVCSFAIVLAIALRWQENSPSRRELVIGGHLYALALTHHLTAVFWLPMLVVLLWRKLSRQQLLWVIVGGISGAWAYLLLIWRSSQLPLANWGDVSSGLSAFFSHITARLYTDFLQPVYPDFIENFMLNLPGAVRRPIGGVIAGVSGVNAWFVSLPAELTIGGMILVILALVLLWRRYPRLFVALIALLLPLGGFTGLYQAAHTAANYRLPLMLMGVVWGGLGIAALVNRWRWSVVLPVALGVWLLLLNYPLTDLSTDHDALDWAMIPLELAPENALILSTSDEDSFMLWYLHHVEGVRPDVYIVARFGLEGGWLQRTLMQHYPELELTPDVELFTWVRQQMRVRAVLSLDTLPVVPDIPVTNEQDWYISNPE